uniref:Ribonuclease Z n=1 Tax=Acrosorium ciliolatum TaxID=1550622 RepID=A0A1Z1M1G3_9FLOR|nr:ribonuclease Z [Acrosorium ciliolatum]ARW59917.1 ribonuclease Z [Acrosorium ciliolatum]
MDINYLNRSIIKLRNLNYGFILRLTDFKDLWILNCCEGCQYRIIDKGYKINNMSKIIITSLHINNISGLLGLLSSLNLIGRIKSLHIYGPVGLKYYLDLGKKYSHTNFNYIVYIHILKTGLVINHSKYRIYSLITKNQYQFIIIQLEQYGTFLLNQAKKNYLTPSPLYGKLKRGLIFLLPDGFILNGCKFTAVNLLGNQFFFALKPYCNRKIVENSLFSSIIIYQ